MRRRGASEGIRGRCRRVGLRGLRRRPSLRLASNFAVSAALSRGRTCLQFRRLCLTLLRHGRGKGEPAPDVGGWTSWGQLLVTLRLIGASRGAGVLGATAARPQTWWREIGPTPVHEPGKAIGPSPVRLAVLQGFAGPWRAVPAAATAGGLTVPSGTRWSGTGLVHAGLGPAVRAVDRLPGRSHGTPQSIRAAPRFSGRGRPRPGPAKVSMRGLTPAASAQLPRHPAKARPGGVGPGGAPDRLEVRRFLQRAVDVALVSDARTGRRTLGGLVRATPNVHDRVEAARLAPTTGRAPRGPKRLAAATSSLPIVTVRMRTPASHAAQGDAGGGRAMSLRAASLDRGQGARAENTGSAPETWMAAAIRDGRQLPRNTGPLGRPLPPRLVGFRSASGMASLRSVRPAALDVVTQPRTRPTEGADTADHPPASSRGDRTGRQRAGIDPPSRRETLNGVADATVPSAAHSSAAAPAVDVNRLSDEVWHRIQQHIRIERERRGR